MLQLDKCQHKTKLIISLLPEDSFTSLVLPDLALTRKSSRSPRPDTDSNLAMEPRVENALSYKMDYGPPGYPLRHVSLSGIRQVNFIFGFLPEDSLLLLLIDVVNHWLQTGTLYGQLRPHMSLVIIFYRHLKKLQIW